MTTTSLQAEEVLDLETVITREVFEMLRRTRPASRQDLGNYVKVFLGIDVPDQRICPGHSSPMDCLRHSVSADDGANSKSEFRNPHWAD
jgi:hypothetical protein